MNSFLKEYSFRSKSFEATVISERLISFVDGSQYTPMRAVFSNLPAAFYSWWGVMAVLSDGCPPGGSSDTYNISLQRASLSDLSIERLRGFIALFPSYVFFSDRVFYALAMAGLSSEDFPQIITSDRDSLGRYYTEYFVSFPKKVSVVI